MVLLWLEAVPALDDSIVELFVEVERLNAVVGDADSDVRELHSCFDCLVECEALAGLQGTESLVHRFVHDFADEALVGGPLREAERLDFVEYVGVLAHRGSDVSAFLEALFDADEGFDSVNHLLD
jgi:hypothetical protein